MDKSTSLERLVRFDSIRASKLLEMVQNGIIIFFLAFFIGSFIDKQFKSADENMSNSELVLNIVLQFAVILIAAYYIRKIAEAIPFLLSISSSYVSNMKGESSAASAFACSLIFVSIQRNFAAKLGLLKSRYALNF